MSNIWTCRSAKCHPKEAVRERKSLSLVSENNLAFPHGDLNARESHDVLCRIAIKYNQIGVHAFCDSAGRFGESQSLRWSRGERGQDLRERESSLAEQLELARQVRIVGQIAYIGPEHDSSARS